MASPSAVEKTCKPEISNAKPTLAFASPLFAQTPFNPHDFIKPTFSKCVSGELLHNFHKAIASKSHELLENLRISAAQNPLFSKLLSFSSQFHSSYQVHCRNLRSMNSLSNHNFAAVLPSDSVAGIVVANGIINFLNIYNTLLVARLVLTWFPNAPAQIVSPLSTLCDPYLNIFRGLIPPLGGTLDLSPILAFLVLNVFTSSASALPAELPKTETGVSHEASSVPTMSELTSTQEKWRRRLQSRSSGNSNGGN